jgi:hypothetical protein
MINASEFNSSRKTVNSDTKNRIEQILCYVLDCHNLMSIDKVKFSLAEIKKSKIKPENKFRNYLVDNYLRNNIHLLNTIGTDHIYFDKETEETFIKDEIEQTDKIDIYIRDGALDKIMKQNKQNIYFAIECKRIKIKSDSKEYVLDIEKFSNRNHISSRLPFEAQIAFIENSNLNHKIVSDEVNSLLKANLNIKTDLFLKNERLHTFIHSSYLSKHRRSFNQQSFSIYHLMLDYTKIVLN